jgi:RimJ/RimL family protein N-acetyltransferase
VEAVLPPSPAPDRARPTVDSSDAECAVALHCPYASTHVDARREAATIWTPRLRLVPLRPDDADEMASVLGDDRLHEFIGGHPLTAAELRDRYTRLAAGAPDLGETGSTGSCAAAKTSRRSAPSRRPSPPGTAGARRTSHVAWVIGVDFQGRGFASEAAEALVEWLWGEGMDDVVAHIHPDHRASALVAARAGLEATDEEFDGETVWRASRDR